MDYDVYVLAAHALLGQRPFATTQCRSVLSCFSFFSFFFLSFVLSFSSLVVALSLTLFCTDVQLCIDGKVWDDDSATQCTCPGGSLCTVCDQQPDVEALYNGFRIAASGRKVLSTLETSTDAVATFASLRQSASPSGLSYCHLSVMTTHI